MGNRWIKKHNHTRANLILEDAGVNAYRGKNRHEGRLKRFLEEIESGRVKKGSILLVENLDRLSREGIHPALTLFGKILESGIDIVVLEPYEQYYRKESANDLIGMLIPLIHFYLAYLESQKKSARLKEAWNEKRRLAEQGEKFNRRCPSWIRWSDKLNDFDKKDGWEAIPVIFQMSRDGYGHHRILAALQKSYKPLGTSGSWNGSFVNSVLSDRAVLGELQPMEMDDDGNRIPIGPAIPNYYPRVVEDELWYQSKSARKSRARQKGPDSKFINLFNRLLFCAQDQSAMHVCSSTNSKAGRVRRLVSYKHKSKQVGAWPVTLEYEAFERTVLSFLSELNPVELRPSKDQSQLRAKEMERTGLSDHLSELQKAITNPELKTVVTLAHAIKDVETKLNSIDQELERLRQASFTQNPIIESQGVLGLLDGSPSPEETERLRSKIRMLLPEFIESIWVKPENYKSKSVAIIQINFVDGGSRHILMLPDRAIGTGDVKIKTGKKTNVFPHSPLPIAWTVDLRHPEGQLYWSAKKIIATQDSALVVPVPSSKPKTLGEAAKKWLVIRRNELESGSFRTIPAAIGRTVKSLGRDLPCENLNKQKWGKWKRTLKKMLQEGDLSQTTARVNYNRSKEFLGWLFQEGLAQEWSGWKESAAKVLQDSTTKQANSPSE